MISNNDKVKKLGLILATAGIGMLLFGKFGIIAGLIVFLL